MKDLSKFEIVVEPERCTGCLICALRFNPMKARIMVITYFDRDNEISFEDQCDSCGICARHCPYGALTLKDRKN